MTRVLWMRIWGARALVLGLVLGATAGCMIIETRSGERTSGDACDTTYGDGDCLFVVDGVVVDAESGLPVANAQVRVGDDYSYTDREGMFALSVYAEPGCYQLMASHMDYAPDSVEVQLDDSDVTVGPVGLWGAP